MHKHFRPTNRLFTLVYDVFAEHIQKLARRSVFFADDLVLLGESI